MISVDRFALIRGIFVIVAIVAYMSVTSTSAQIWVTATPVPTDARMPAITPQPTRTPLPPGRHFMATPFPQQILPNPNPARKLLILSIDGLRANTIDQSVMPNLAAFAERGAASFAAQTITPPRIIPAHTSMLTGLSPEEHGVVWDDFREVTVSPPLVLTMLQQSGFRTAMVVHDDKFRQLWQDGAVGYHLMMKDDDVVQQAVALLEAGVDVLFAQLSGPDFAGREEDRLNPTDLMELGNTDAQIGRLLFTLERLGLRDSTLVVITSGYSGAATTVPWIIAGPGVVSGIDLGNRVSIRHTAGTVMWALGLPVGEDMLPPVYEAFGIAQEAGN